MGHRTRHPKDIKAALDGGAVKIVTEKQFRYLPILGAMNVSSVYGRLIDQISFDETSKRLLNCYSGRDGLAS